MPNYQESKIYKIVSFSTDDVYIGSTCEKYISNRLGSHRTAYKSYLNGKHRYVTSFKLLETGDYYIELIENYPCNNIYELHARERYWIENTENCVNKVVSNRTLKQHYEDYKNKRLEQMKHQNQKHQNCYIVKIKRDLDNDIKQLNSDIEFVNNLN